MAEPFVPPMEETAQALVGTDAHPLEIEAHAYDETWSRIIVNGFRQRSDFDLIAVDAGWVGEFARAGYLTDLGDALAREGVSASDFLPSAWQSGFVDGVQVAIPIQPHPELLLLRADLLARASIPYPTTLDRLFAAADRLRALGETAAICWNAAEGAALGQTALHLLAAHGSVPLSEDYRPQFDTAAALAMAGTLRDLWDRGPPGIERMAWDERIAAYARGDCAFTYIWTARAAQLARTAPDVYAASTLIAAPTGAGVAPISPLGIWLLAIPANLDPQRLDRVVGLLARLVSPEAASRYIEAGATATAVPIGRLTLAGPPPAPLALVERLDREGGLATDMRPPIPEFQAITQIVGSRLHAMLRDDENPTVALSDLQAMLTDLMVRHGYR